MSSQPKPPTVDEINAYVRAAYDPDGCESCEIEQATCWECADDAVAALTQTT